MPEKGFDKLCQLGNLQLSHLKPTEYFDRLSITPIEVLFSSPLERGPRGVFEQRKCARV